MAERITAAKAARIAGVCAKTMRGYAKRNIVPGAVLFDRTWRFDEAKLRRWIRERETGGWQTKEISSNGRASGTRGAKCEVGMYDEAYERLLSPKRGNG